MRALWESIAGSNEQLPARAVTLIIWTRAPRALCAAKPAWGSAGASLRQEVGALYVRDPRDEHPASPVCCMLRSLPAGPAAPALILAEIQGQGFSLPWTECLRPRYIFSIILTLLFLVQD